MSSDLYSKQKDNASATSLAVAPPLSNNVTASTLRGQKLNLPAHQIPMVNPNDIINNYWNFPANGNFNTALQDGGVQQITIARGQGSGKTTGKVWIHLNVTNTDSSDITIAPAPFLFSNIVLQTPSGDIINTWDPLGLWLSLIGTTSFEEWQTMSDLVYSSNDYQTGDPIHAGASVDIWLPLVGNVFSVGEVATRVIEGDTQLYLTFAQPSVSVIRGATDKLQINSLAAVFEMQQLDASLIKLIDDEYDAFSHSFLYPFMRVMNFTQTWNSNSQYTLQLSGITGNINQVLFALRTSNAGQAAYHGAPIDSFQIQNQEGISLTGAQFVDEEQNRWAQLPKWYLGTWSQDRRFYGWSFASKDSSPVEFLLAGRSNGSYGFGGREQLVINTAPTATNEVLTLRTANSAATSADCYGTLVWTTPEGGTSYSAPINLDTISNAALKSAIEALPNFEGTVTIGDGPIGTSGSVTVTFGGNYAGRPMFSAGFYLEIIGVAVTAGPIYTNMVTIETTPGVRGITNGGTYTLTIVAFSSSIMSVSSEREGGSGRLRIQNS